MKEIIINSPKHGCKVVLVDDQDYEWLNQYKWYVAFHKPTNTFYVRQSKRKKYDKIILMHRLIMGVMDRKILIDHINHNGLHNFRSNLRKATSAQNSTNLRSAKNSSSKYLGVSWDTLNSKWKAQIRGDKIKRGLGLFSNEEDAARAYNQAAIKYHGEFSNLNLL